LAEALLFYQNVHIVLEYPSLGGLISQIGMPTLLSLLSRPNVSAVYCEEILGTHTEDVGAMKSYSFVGATLTGSQDAGKLHSRQKRLEHVLHRHGYEKRQARRLVERFRQHVPIRKLTDNHFVNGGVVNAAWEDLFDPNFIHESMRRVVSHMIEPELPPAGFRFSIHPNAPAFYIDTNLDFEAINAKRKSHDPTLNDVTPGHLINNVLMARADTVLAAHYGGEFYTSDLTSEIVRLRHRELLRRIGLEQQELRELTEIVIQDSPTIREVINSGERTFDEFLSLLDKSQRFREWVQGVNPDEKLVQAYLRDVTAEDWISKLPSKTLRYFVGAVVGLVAPVAGLALSAADSLFLEKMLGGWRPSHFVQRQLKPFVNKAEDEF